MSIPNMGANMGTIISETMRVIDLINTGDFFNILGAFWLIIMVLGFIIRLVTRPPKLDI